MAAKGDKKKSARPQTRRKPVAPKKTKGAGLATALADARAQQAATAQILRVIARSPADVQPVFDAIAASAMRLFGGHAAAVTRVVGDMLHLASLTATSEAGNEALKSRFPQPLSSPAILSRAALSGKPVFSSDMESDPEVSPSGRETARARGYRSLLAVPMLRESSVIGTISVTRREPGPFTDHQVNLLETFADQAVIAIENVRLFNDTKEALERQTATGEILKVIAGSPTDVQPVFDVIVERAVKLCGARFGRVYRYDGSLIHMVASHGLSSGGLGLVQRTFPRPAGDDTIVGMVIQSRRPYYCKDIETDRTVPVLSRQMIEALDTRSQVTIPMLRAGEPIGAITMGWAEPGAFNAQQVALLQTFADQAVIAIENVRLFNETKEALERQTATAEILKVIAASPTDVQPVFSVIAESSMRLFRGQSAVVTRLAGDMLQLAAMTSTSEEGNESVRKSYPRPLSSPSLNSTVVRSGKPAHWSDIENDPTASPELKERARARGMRSNLIVPMLREGQAIGTISVTRAEPGTFTPHQIHLLETFADQAVIAIENVRLFNETKEALERQTATAEILNVIAGSPADVQPVFDAIARSALKLIAGRSALVVRRVADELHLAAHTATNASGDEALKKTFPMALTGQGFLGKAVLSGMPGYVSDVESEAGYSPPFREMMRARGTRSMLAVPMIREGAAIGAINVTRSTPGPFTEHQVNLVKTFAAQAVIAIENVRLFNETKESLERQTATSEILGVISRSPNDVTPVFETILDNAARLCGSPTGAIFRFDGELVHLLATKNWSPEALELVSRQYPMAPTRSKTSGKTILTKSIVRQSDTLADPEYDQTGATAGRWRRMLGIPMLREGEPIGAFVMTWPDPGETPEHHVQLLKTFADQAVIAIENVRLFNETKEALERQTATAEILKVISESPTNVQPVFDAIVAGANRLCEADFGGLFLAADGQLAPAHTPASPEEEKFLRANYPRPVDSTSLVGRSIVERRVVHVPDLENPATPPRLTSRNSYYRSQLTVPMLREGKSIGAIVAARQRAGAFTVSQIDLLKTFADQAVIAIENVRLFKELEARTEALSQSVGQLTALGEVGQAISSTLDLETVLKTIVSHAIQLTGLDGGAIYEYDERTEEFRLQISENMAEELMHVARLEPIRLGNGAIGRAGITREPVQVPDTLDESYQSGRKELLIRSGYRAVLAVPLLREDNLLGALLVTRKTPGPFGEEVVELLKTFATQSAMAIQNARLFREIAEKGRQLEVASHHKSDFLASMSHELRTPLNAILGFNELILAEIYGEVPEGIKEPLNDIQTSGKHLLRLINNVLDLAKIEAGRMELSLSDYSVHDTVESVRSTLRPLAADKGLEFLASVPEDIPLAFGDSGRIAQCLMNLAGNSLKFTKAGKVEIAVESNGDILTYRVTDTGIGIAPDKIETVFAEFKQSDATIASEYGGTGLGLSISRKFVEMHGGRIWVESELGKGSSFIFEIPLRVGGRTAEGAAP